MDRRELQPAYDSQLDEALEETFPASDAPANTVETGIGLDPALPVSGPVVDNRAAEQFELRKDGQLAFLAYQRRGGALVLVHTEVPPSLRGHHVGETLVQGALAAARASGLTIVAICPFAQAYLRTHPSSTPDHL